MTLIKEATNIDGIRVKEAAAQATPPSGFGQIGAETDGNLYWTDDTGTKTQLNGGGGGGGSFAIEGVIAYTNHTVDSQDEFFISSWDTIQLDIGNYHDTVAFAPYDIGVPTGKAGLFIATVNVQVWGYSGITRSVVRLYKDKTPVSGTEREMIAGSIINEQPANQVILHSLCSDMLYLADGDTVYPTLKVDDSNTNTWQVKFTLRRLGDLPTPAGSSGTSFVAGSSADSSGSGGTGGGSGGGGP